MELPETKAADRQRKRRFDEVVRLQSKLKMNARLEAGRDEGRRKAKKEV